MLTRVPAHLLKPACEAAGTTVEALSFETGIPVEELLAIDAGEIAMSAEGRCCIVTNLLEHFWALPPQPEGEPPLDFDAVSRKVSESARVARSQMAIRQLLHDADEERELE